MRAQNLLQERRTTFYNSEISPFLLSWGLAEICNLAVQVDLS